MFVNGVTYLVSSVALELQVLGFNLRSEFPWFQPLLVLQNICSWPFWYYFDLICRGLASSGFLVLRSSLNRCFRLSLMFLRLSLHMSLSFCFSLLLKPVLCALDPPGGCQAHLGVCNRPVLSRSNCSHWEVIFWTI